MDTPKLLPVPSTPRSEETSVFSFDLPVEKPLPKTPKSPLRTPSFFTKNSEIQKRKLFEKETINSLEVEGLRIRGNIEARKNNDDTDYEEFVLKEGEKRTYLTPKSIQEKKFQNVLRLLEEWVNELLDDQEKSVRITSIKNDFFDGVIFKKIVEKLTGKEIKIPLAEDVQAKERQMINLTAVLDKISDILRLTPDLAPWTPESVFEQNLLTNVQILLALIEHFGPGGKIMLQLPKILTVNVVVLHRQDGRIESISKPMIIFKHSGQKDAFDQMLDQAPEKVNYVKRNLLEFCNTSLKKLKIEIESLEKDFCTGVNLILLIGQVQGFYVPLYEYNQNPETYEEKMENVELAMSLMSEMDFQSRNHNSDVIQGNLRAVMRIIFHLYAKYNKSPQ